MAYLRILIAWAGGVCIAAVTSPPVFHVDLELPPERRWEGVVKTVLQAHSFEDGFLPTFREHNTSLFNNLQPEHWRLIGQSVRQNYPEQAAELASFSAQFAHAGHPVSFEYLAAWAYFHELAHTDLMKATVAGTASECTAVLVRNSRGRILHGANMDQTPEAVRKITLRVIFVRGAETVFEGVDWYWFNSGVTRAVRRGVASLQENWREGETIPHEQVFKDIQDGVISQVWVFRRLLTAPPGNFEEVLRHLESVRLAAPFYIAVGGPDGVGAIITRNQTSSLETVRLDASSNSWFIVHSNFDRWLPDPASDPRRTVGEQTMRSLGSTEGSSLLGLFAAMSTYPVHNPNTAYTALMDPEAGALHAYVREALCPEDPLQNKGERYCHGRNRAVPPATTVAVV